jgi:glucokinase
MPDAPREAPLLIVADVGGTNTRAGLARGTEVDVASVRRYRNDEFATLADALAAFREEAGAPAAEGACVAVAGPVADGVARLTNRDWSIDTATLIQATGARRGAILNDLQAQGHALGHLPEGSLGEVVAAPASPARTRLVVGVGTGFNATAVHPTRSGRLVPPAEAGHAGLPVHDEAELRLCAHLRGLHGFPAVEEVLSGRGLTHVYSWLAAEAGARAAPPAAQIMRDVETDPRAEATVRQVVRTLGRVTGDLALIHLPYGGIHLVGGVARALGPWLGPFGFAQAFRDKGRFAPFMEGFAVTLVTDDYAALTGCAAHLDEALALGPA